MSVTDVDRIDIVATRPGSNAVVLVVADHLPWDDLDEHLRVLQAKLNTYIAFIESGQLLQVEEPPIPANPDVRIRVVMRHAPPPAAHEFFKRAGAVLEGIGVGFDQSVELSATN